MKHEGISGESAIEVKPAPLVEQHSDREPDYWGSKEILGINHLHSKEGSSCGKDTLRAIKETVKGRTGLQYLAFAEHVGWPGEEYWFPKIREEFRAIDELNNEEPTPHIFKGIEANVLPDNTLDTPDDLMKDADIVVASIHYKNSHQPEEMTAKKTVESWCKVMDRYQDVNFLGHPLRDLPTEEWPKMDWDTLCQKAAEKNVAIELSISDAAWKEKDLPLEFFAALKKYGNLISIAPDFHNIGDYLEPSKELSGEQEALLKEYRQLTGEIAGITFNRGEEVKGRGLGRPEYTSEQKEEKLKKLKELRRRLREIEDSKELAKIYGILSSNLKYKENEKGEVTGSERKPLPSHIFMKYVRRMNKLRKHQLPKENIVNLWSEEKFSDWIQSRKRMAEISTTMGV